MVAEWCVTLQFNRLLMLYRNNI